LLLPHDDDDYSIIQLFFNKAKVSLQNIGKQKKKQTAKTFSTFLFNTITLITSLHYIKKKRSC